MHTVIVLYEPYELLDMHRALYCEVLSLALDLCETEGYTLANAMRVAADDLSYCLDYAVAWNDAAFAAGNEDASDLPF